MSRYVHIYLFYLKIVEFLRKPFELFGSGNKEDNITTIIYRAFKYHGIGATLGTVSEYIGSHPDFPSLKSIIDFFNETHVQNYALKFDERDIENFDHPFIAHLKEAGGKVIFVYSVNDGHVVYADTLKGKKIMPKPVFLEKWDGVVIVLEPDELSGEVGYKEKRKAEITDKALLPTVILLFVFAMLYGIIGNKFISPPPENVDLALIFAHFVGLAFSILLMRQELDLKTRFTDKLCHIAANADCDAVTNSKASKIFGPITWADAGVAYFTGGLVFLFLVPLNNTIDLLMLVSIAALPYPVFSILYQWLKIKKWCPFCLSVQFVIIVEAVLAFGVLNIDTISTKTVFPVFLIFLAVFLFVLLTKFLYLSEKEKRHAKLELLKIKRDPDVFLHKLRKGERIGIPDDKNALIFGDNRSNVSVTVFLSFHCSACAKRFGSILELIEKNYKIKLQIVLSPGKDENTISLMKTIFKMKISGQNREILEKLDIWYKTERSKRHELLETDQDNGIIEGFEEMVEYNSMLFRTEKIVGVPSVYINGYPLPNNYTLEDINYHITALEKMRQVSNEIEV
jgi:uncharacterized membrane protein